MSFLNALHMWHDFFVGTSVTSAALLGFTYLALSQHGDRGGERAGSHTLEGQTLGSLFAVLIVSLLVLIPEQSPRSLGIILLVATILGLASMGRFLSREARASLGHASASFVAWRIALPVAAVAAAACASIMLLAGSRNTDVVALYVLSAPLLALLLIAARHSWELLGHSGQERLKIGRRN